MKFDEQVENIIKIAVAESLTIGNVYVTPEHILFGMCQDDDFIYVIETKGGSVANICEDLEGYFRKAIPISDKELTEDTIDVSVGFSKVIEVATASAKNSGNSSVKMSHLLWGILELDESFARFFLEKEIDDCVDLMIELQQLLEDTDDIGMDIEDGEGENWKRYAVLLNDIVAEKNPVIGRDAEMNRAISILCRKDKNNPIFVGEPGVGKSAMAIGLTKRIVSGNVPDTLKDAKVFSLDIASLLAGTQYRGEFEKRIKDTMREFQNEANPIVFLDEIHNLIGAGGMSGGSMDASNILKPYLEDGTIRFMGSTTYDDFKKSFAKNTALLRRFQKVDLKEPTKEETVAILNGLKKTYEKYHKVRYGKGTMEYAVELSARFINDKFLPDKALDLIDEAGAYRKLHPVPDKKNQLVDKHVIEEVLSSICNIPLQTAKSSEIEMLRSLYSNITSKIFGQNEAVKKIVDSICMSRAGLLDENKPIASFLFVGPTGVGKTEVAKVLAKELNIQLVRFDMSEYAEKHTVAKLIGSPAGYVGYEDGGLLTDAIRKNPHCVLLLDEIEKAHADIYNILLQVMDYASLTDSKGQKADFRNVIIIMTSNAGARLVGKTRLGFAENSYDNGAMMEEVKRVFAPEFRNRLSSIVTFNGISSEMAKLIADKKLGELMDKLENKKISLNVTNKAKEYLISRGSTREYGAREIDRIINVDVKPLLVNEILFGKLKKGGKAHLDYTDRTFKVSLNSNSYKVK